MAENIKRGIITLIGGAGLIVLLMGIFGFYRFEIGLIAAIAIWIVTGAVSNMLGVSKKKEIDEGKRTGGRGWIWAVVVAVLLILGGLYLLSFIFNRGSGHLTTETRNVSGYTKIALNGSGKLNLTQGNEEGLTIEGEDNIINKITTEVSDDTLEISQKNWWFSVWPTKNIIYNVKVKNLSRISLSGSGEINTDSLNGDSLTLTISGSGKTDMKIKYNNLDSKINGSGNINLSGEAQNQNVDISGSGDYSAKNLVSKSADIEISGSGKALVNTSEKLDVKIAGSGKIQYLGNPSITQDIAGSGKIEKLSN